MGHVAEAPSPPLPPWPPGMAPPVAGPVFSQAFVALLFVMAAGCSLLCGQLFFKVRAILAEDVGEDSRMLTAAHDGNWLKSIQKSRGRAVMRAPLAANADGDIEGGTWRPRVTVRNPQTMSAGLLRPKSKRSAKPKAKGASADALEGEPIMRKASSAESKKKKEKKKKEQGQAQHFPDYE